MTRSKLLLSWIACAWLAAACGDNRQAPKDAAPPEPDAAEVALAPCVERPTELARPPTGALPCELLPPGFTPAK